MTSTPTPRIGSETSETRARLVEAAAELLLEEGYAAVTSRKVAAKAGLKPQLVHYYFRTMDDLYLEVLRHRAEENLARFADAISEDGSLTNIWRLNTDPRGAVFSLEFMALANHRKSIRDEVAKYAERFRNAQLDAARAALRDHGISEDVLPPVVALIIATGVGQFLTLEEGLGVTGGHDETRRWVERAIADLEGRTAGAGR